ncbi:MAG: hypothetical protein ACR2I0_03305, partial [Rhodoferax sp.]
GVVITFVDISNAKALEGTLREVLTILQARIGEPGAQGANTDALKAMLHKAHQVLEGRLSSQAVDLRKTPIEHRPKHTGRQ